MKGGSVTGSPSCVWCPRLRVGVPLVVYLVALLNGGGACVVMPCLRIGFGILCCSTPSCIVQSPFSLCVCCHSIVGLGLCLCDRVVSLWNGGVGLCRCGMAWGVCCLHIIVLWCASRWCASRWCVSCLVALCCECGMAGVRSRRLSSSSLCLLPLLFVLVFGVVRAQPCEHARYPRTPLCL